MITGGCSVGIRRGKRSLIAGWAMVGLAEDGLPFEPLCFERNMSGILVIRSGRDGGTVLGMPGWSWFAGVLVWRG